MLYYNVVKLGTPYVSYLMILSWYSAVFKNRENAPIRDFYPVCLGKI